MLAILEAFLLFFPSFQDGLTVGSDCSSALSRISSKEGPWRFHFLSDIKVLSSIGFVEFKHVGRPAKAMMDALAKQGVDRVVPFVAYTM